MKSPVINDHAPGMRARAVSSQGQAADGGTPAPAAGDWAICCSGGGIRSAAYCLGAPQRLDRIGLLAKVRWILGVSGGGYIASSRALVAHNLLAYAKSHATFPGDSTLEQLYDAPEFEAYRQLGTATVRDAARNCQPKLTWAPPPVAVPVAPAASRRAAQRGPR